MKVLGIIPARYDSTRFPGKVLVDIKGKTMLQRVYEAASKSDKIDELVIATDNSKVENTAKGFCEQVVITSDKHISGTDRCCEAYERLQKNYDVVINIQCDLPLLKAEALDTLIDCFNDAKTQIATLAAPIQQEEKLENPNTVKVIFDDHHNAIYFSRTAIPFCRDVQKEEWLETHDYFEHVGLYAYRPDTLKKVVQLPPTKLEQAEKLEQLRWIEHGYKIKVGQYNQVCMGVDTPQDLEIVLSKLEAQAKAK